MNWPGHRDPTKVGLTHSAAYSDKALSWLLDVTNRVILPAIERIEKGNTKMDADIQEAIADVAALKSVVASSNAAFKVLTDMNAAQAATIADLETKVGSGTDVTADDLAALKASNVDFKQALVDLQPAVPANTPAV